VARKIALRVDGLADALRCADARRVKLALTAVLGLTLFVACRGQADGINQADVLPTPLTGNVLTIHPQGHDCIPDGCPFAYTLKVTNPMDRDAQVKSCEVTGDQVELTLNTVSGVDVRAGATRRVDGYRYLPLAKNEAAALVGSAVTCEGLDWHGDPPV